MNLGTMKETEGVVLNTSLEKSNVQNALVAKKEVALAPEKIDGMLSVIDTSDLSTITRFGAESLLRLCQGLLMLFLQILLLNRWKGSLLL